MNKVAICTIVCTVLAARTVHALPSFVTEPPSDEQYYYEFGEAEGRDEKRALKLAEERARESLRHQIETRIDVMQLDYEVQTGSRRDGFFTELRRVASDITLQAQIVKSESEGIKYYVLMSTKGVEDEVLKRVLEYAQKTNDVDFELAAKKSMRRAFDKAGAVIAQAEAEQKKAAAEKKAEQKWKDFKTKLSGFFDADLFKEYYPLSYWSVGLNLGAAFTEQPALTITPNITIPIVAYLDLGFYLDLGCDFGFLTNNSYYYPYIRGSLFTPFGDEFGFHIGLGYGCMIADHSLDVAQKIIPAFDFATGFLLINAIDISYSVRTDFNNWVSHKISLGFVYRLGQN